MSETKPTSNEFLLKEYDALHRKLDLLTHEQLVIARWALGFTGIFWAYLAVAQPGWLPMMAYLTPAIFVGLLGLRTLTLNATVRKMRKYLLSMESHMDLPGVMGWEKQRLRDGSAGIRAACWLYWILLLVINIGVATVYIPMLRGH